MSEPNKIILALKNKSAEFSNINEQYLEPIQEGVYHLHTTPPYFIKWIRNDDRLGQNEIWVNQTILQKEIFLTPRLIFTIRLDEGSVACWEWLNGMDLRNKNRDYLPKAFAHLGHFHAQERHNQAVTSLITHKSYDTPWELLEDEHKFLCAYHDVSIARKAKDAFLLLQLGYPTYVHGDFHPGNIKLRGKNLKFVDWSYCTSSLCLFDLGYIETIENICFDSTEVNEWWRIRPEEAKRVLPAYFNASGLDSKNIYQIHQAVMLWAKLWAYYNSIRNNDKTGAIKCKQQIELLIDIK